MHLPAWNPIHKAEVAPAEFSVIGPVQTTLEGESLNTLHNITTPTSAAAPLKSKFLSVTIETLHLDRITAWSEPRCARVMLTRILDTCFRMAPSRPGCDTASTLLRSDLSRVTNLRRKAPGNTWTRDRAEQAKHARITQPTTRRIENVEQD